MPQILEDIGQLSIAGYFLAPDTPVDYFITNVNATTEAVQCCGFTTWRSRIPQHTYDAFEVTLNKRFSGNWSAIASYRFSKLEGNFEGFFRSDNGQSDPAISSLFDFPTNDPSYTALSRHARRLGRHPLPGLHARLRHAAERPAAPVEALRQLRVERGQLRPRLQRRLGPLADGDGLEPGLRQRRRDSDDAPRRGMDTVDGFLERTPAEVTLDLHVRLRASKFGGRRADAARRRVQPVQPPSADWYDYWVETTVGTLNPNFGSAGQRRRVRRRRRSRRRSRLRFGARFDW